MWLRGVHHVALGANDVERVAAFYREVLGLPERTRHHDADGLRSIWLEAAGVLLMIERSGAGPSSASGEEPRPAGGALPSLRCLAFAIGAEERAAWRARLEERGHPIERESAFTLYTRDPEGNPIGLSSWPEAGTSA